MSTASGNQLAFDVLPEIVLRRKLLLGIRKNFYGIDNHQAYYSFREPNNLSFASALFKFQLLHPLRKRAYRRFAFGQSEDLGVAVVFVVHSAEVGIGVEHVLLGGDVLVLHCLGLDADPPAAVKGAELHIRIGQNLF